MTIDGHLLKSWGIAPGPMFKDLLAEAHRLAGEGVDEAAIKARILAQVPPAPAILMRRAKGSYSEAIAAESDEDRDNITAVRRHMDHLMRCPVIEQGAIMPDACPSGQAPGTIPVGGAVVSRAIHPAFHSADICCSMYATLFPQGTQTRRFMDVLQSQTRFGPGGRSPDQRIQDPITDELDATANPFLAGLDRPAKAQLADQGDGNHFAFFGSLSVTPQLIAALLSHGQSELARALDRSSSVDALITHHGSRELGARVYKRGVLAAVEQTLRVSPDTPPHQAWLDPATRDGQLYWQALDYVGRWTRRNHQLIHERTLARLEIQPLAAFGNEHNFVWAKDGMFYHGKGATPAWKDASGHPLLGLIPLNMASPILLTLGRDNAAHASFSPHGAGRNKSRTALLKELGLHGLTGRGLIERSRALLDRQTQGLDVRFFFDRPDVSESPLAYKSADQVRAQIERFALADVIGLIMPKGCIMAGDYDKPWMMKRAGRGAGEQQAE